MVIFLYRTPKEEEELKFWYMRLHKSCGLLMGMCMIPRVYFRLTSKIPAPLPGPEWFQKTGVLAHKGYLF